MFKINFNEFEKLMISFHCSNTHLLVRFYHKRQARELFQIKLLIGFCRVISCFPALATG